MARARQRGRGGLDFAQGCFARFLSIDGFDRAMALAAQAFTRCSRC